MTVLGQLVTVAPADATNWLRLARTVLQIRPRDDSEKALLLDRASTAAYIAYQRATEPRPGSRQPGAARPYARRPQAMAPGARFHAARARYARERRPARPIRAAAQRARLPHAGLLGRFRRRFAARLLPVLGRIARQAHRFLALRRGGGPGQAGDLGQRQAAMRRGPQARRALRDHAARRPAVGGARDAGEIGRLHHLRARPQAVRALFRQGLCAAAHRPARHPGAQRQHQRGRAVDLSHRRPQSASTPCSATISSET